jgi:CheY-like chemotaxis protein
VDTLAETAYADVLVVDDDEAVRTTIAEILRSDGYSVQEAADGMEALEFLEDMTFGLMLLDVSMPNVDGLQLLRLSNELPPVVIVSAHHYDATTVAPDDDVFMFLRKPVPPPELLDVVAQVLARPATA